MGLMVGWVIWKEASTDVETETTIEWIFFLLSFEALREPSKTVQYSAKRERERDEKKVKNVKSEFCLLSSVATLKSRSVGRLVPLVNCVIRKKSLFGLLKQNKEEKKFKKFCKRDSVWKWNIRGWCWIKSIEKKRATGKIKKSKARRDRGIVFRVKLRRCLTHFTLDCWCFLCFEPIRQALLTARSVTVCIVNLKEATSSKLVCLSRVSFSNVNGYVQHSTVSKSSSFSSTQVFTCRREPLD